MNDIYIEFWASRKDGGYDYNGAVTITDDEETSTTKGDVELALARAALPVDFSGIATVVRRGGPIELVDVTAVFAIEPPSSPGLVVK